MHKVIQFTLRTLQKTEHILSISTDDILSDTSIPPYHSSIGSHIRHILDFYECILNMDSEKRIDLTARRRDVLVESNCSAALQYCNQIAAELKSIDSDVDEHVFVTDDLGTGKIEIKYTLGALFAQANSHTIHHYAIINYIMEGLNISIEDQSFGYNPTTPK